MSLGGEDAPAKGNPSPKKAFAAGALVDALWEGAWHPATVEDAGPSGSEVPLDETGDVNDVPLAAVRARRCIC